MCLKWGQNTKSSVTPKLIIYKACQILSKIFWAFYETSTLICKEHIKKMLISENHCRYFWVNWESQNIWFSVIAVHCNIVSMMLWLGPKKLWAFIAGVQWWLEKKISDLRGFETVNFIHPKDTCYTVQIVRNTVWFFGTSKCILMFCISFETAQKGCSSLDVLYSPKKDEEFECFLHPVAQCFSGLMGTSQCILAFSICSETAHISCSS